MKMKNRVLAVLALALLMINMAPMRKANAAETYVPDWRTEIKYNSSYREDALQYKYLYVTYEYENNNYDNLRYIFCNDYTVELHNGVYYLTPYDYQLHGVLIMKTSNPYTYEWSSISSGQSVNVLNYGNIYKCSAIVASNWDWRGGNADLMGYVAGGLNYPEVPEPDYEYRYSSSGPVAASWSAGISNLMKFVPAGADDIDDFYVQSNWAAQFDKWKYTIIYRVQGELPALAGSSPTDGNMYKLYTESVIAFPSKDVVTGWISSGMSPVECYFEKGQTNWRNTVYDGKNTFVKVKVTNESIPSYHSLMNGSHAFQVDIPMQDVIAAVDESFDGGLRGYYGLSQEMWDMWKYSIFEYKVPYEIYTVLYAKEDVDTMVYGNMHYSVSNWTNIDPLSQGYVFTGGVIEKPLEDITDNDKQEIQIDTTREELAKRTEELEQLKKEYAESLKMNGSDEDVFELFSNFTAGLRSSSSSFKNVATAVGNVFAFFPQDITGLLYGGIIVMIVIAIVKAIRG